MELNNGNFMRSIDNLHKYFDKNLRFLSNKDKVDIPGSVLGANPLLLYRLRELSIRSVIRC